MGYGPKINQPQNFDRPRGVRRRNKAKTRKSKHRFSEGSQLEEKNLLPSEESLRRTFDRLHGLGNQVFAVFPFSEYFDDWLANVRGILNDLELDPTIATDTQFNDECSQILTNLELELEERRCREASYDLAMKKLKEDKRLLEQINAEYATKMGELERRKSREIEHLSRTIQDLREELDRITQMKTGIFRSMSKRTKTRKEAETTQNLALAQDKHELIVPKFSSEQQKLSREHIKLQQPVVERLQQLQKEINSLEIDGSLDARRSACEALTNAMSAFLRRKMLLQ